MNIPNLRSPYDKVGGIVYFGRMIDKIRLHAAGTLPSDYVPNLGSGFDARCVSFLHVDYIDLVNRVTTGPEGETEDAILRWCCQSGREPSAEEIEIWNGYMSKRGWNDDLTERLQQRIQEAGFHSEHGIGTMFDFIDADEGRSVGIRK